MISETLQERSLGESIMFLLPLFFVVGAMIYTATRWLKGDDSALNNMKNVLCAIYLIIIAGLNIWFFKEKAFYFIIALSMLIGLFLVVTKYFKRR